MDVSQPDDVQLIFPTLHKRHIIELMNYVCKHMSYQIKESDLKEHDQMLYWDKPVNMDLDQVLDIAKRLSNPGIRRIGPVILKVYVYIESNYKYILEDGYFNGQHCLRGYRDDGQEFIYNEQFIKGNDINHNCYEKLKLKCGK